MHGSLTFRAQTGLKYILRVLQPRLELLIHDLRPILASLGHLLELLQEFGHESRGESLIFDAFQDFLNLWCD